MLVVDDSKYVQTLVKDYVEITGCDVELAGDGRQALEKYSSGRPDLVLLDVVMPAMDGFETLQALLKIDKEARVVMTTASEDELFAGKSLPRGVVGYLVKPFGQKELREIIAMWSKRDRKFTSFVLSARSGIEEVLGELLGAEITVTVKDFGARGEPAGSEVSFSTDKEKVQYISESGSGGADCVVSSIPRGRMGMFLGGSAKSDGAFRLFDAMNRSAGDAFGRVFGRQVQVKPARLCEETRISAEKILEVDFYVRNRSVGAPLHIDAISGAKKEVLQHEPI